MRDVALRDELEGFLHTLDVELPADLDDDTALISSGCLDSLALFRLVLWVEEKSGRTVDPAAVDLAVAWDSVRRIVDYVEGGADVAPTAESPAQRAARPRSGICIEAYSPDHASAVAELQTGLWSPDPALNRRYLEWKHAENPYAGSPRIYLAFDGGELVAMRGFHPARWEVERRGQHSDVLVADDLLVRESHRNRGVATELMQNALEDLHRSRVPYVFNLSGGRLTVLGSLAMGWRSVGHLKPVGRTTRLHAALAAGRSGLAKLPLLWRHASSPSLYLRSERSPFARLDRSIGASITRDGARIDVSDQLRARDMAALVHGLRYDGRIRHVRDQDYLTWRYRNPLNAYRFLYARGATDGLDGFVALKWTDHAIPNPRVEIVDCEATSEACLAALLDAVISLGDFPELVTWAATRSAAVSRVLTNTGFGPADRHLAGHGCPCILVRACDSSQPPEDWSLHGTPLLDLRRWDVRMIYSMAG